MIPFLLIATLGAIAQAFMPWWIISIIAFGVCFWRSENGWWAFGNGFAGIALVWLLYSGVIHFRTEGILTGRMSIVLLQNDAPFLLLLITSLIGGLVGGFAGLAGYQVRHALELSKRHKIQS